MQKGIKWGGLGEMDFVMVEEVQAQPHVGLRWSQNNPQTAGYDKIKVLSLR